MMPTSTKSLTTRAAVAAMILGMLGAPAAHAAPLLTNLQAWFKADALVLSDNDPVTSWADSSGNSHTATQTTPAARPTYHTNLFNGLPGVTFAGNLGGLDDAIDDFLKTPRIVTASPANGFSYFVVMRTTYFDNVSYYSYNTPQTILGDSTNNVQNGFGVSGANAQYRSVPAATLTGSTTVNNGVATLLEATHANTNVANLYVMGVLEATNPSASYSIYYGVDRIGGGIEYPPIAGDPDTADFFKGDVAEILVYDAVLSPSDRVSVEEYLKFKYALPEPSTLGLLALGGLTLLRRRAAGR